MTNIDPHPKIVISTEQGINDALQALVRYVWTIVGVVTGLVTVIGTGKAEDTVTYIQSNIGLTVGAIIGLSGLVTAGYGIYKSWKRGRELEKVEPLVPDSVIAVKK